MEDIINKKVETVTVDELYEKIDELKEISKIVKKNDFLKYSCLKFLYRIDDLIRYIERYKRMGINIEIHEFGYNCFDKYAQVIETNYIEYGHELEKEETLLVLRFPSWMYTFKEWPNEEFFEAFFKELQEVKPKYISEKYYNLYYDSSNSKEAYEHYRKVYDKYLKKSREEKKKDEVEMLKKQLEEARKKLDEEDV